MRNGLYQSHELEIVASDKDSAPYPEQVAQTHSLDGQALVAWGGGKDSYVADAIARRAGLTAQRCAVVMSDKVEAAIQRTSEMPVLFLRRHLDPKLRDVNAADALNGHVPITAINALMLVILGRLSGAQSVIFANERSADEPTIRQDGIVANHQYSKSSNFENIMRDAIGTADPLAPAYFSVLRPYSEIWIAEKFSALQEAFPRFTSCNQNFRITGAEPPRWCGACAKCAFTSLMLAPHLSLEQARTIFPDNFLERENLLPLYRELCGLTDSKPWDCVGTINECRATVYRLSLSSPWRATRAVRALIPQILALHDTATLETFWQDGMGVADRHFVPDTMMKAAHDL